MTRRRADLLWLGLAVFSAVLLWFVLTKTVHAQDGQLMEVTSYCLHGTTASGTQAGIGTVAADPSIPFHTRLWVEGWSDMHGVGTVLDRGRAITAGHLDVWTPSCREAILWGRRHVLVWVLSDGA